MLNGGDERQSKNRNHLCSWCLCQDYETKKRSWLSVERQPEERDDCELQAHDLHTLAYRLRNGLPLADRSHRELREDGNPLRFRTSRISDRFKTLRADYETDRERGRASAYPDHGAIGRPACAAKGRLAANAFLARTLRP